MSPSAPPPAFAAAARPSGVRRVLAESGYALSAFFLALPAFVLAMTLVATGLGLVVLVGGVLLLTLAALVARGFARVERYRLRALLGRAAATPDYLCPRAADGFWRRMLTPLRDPQSWLDVVWSLVGLVTGTVAFAVTLAWWALAAGGLTYWIWQRFIPYDEDNVTLAELLGLGEGRTPEIWLDLAIGAVALLTLPLVVRLVTTVHASLASVLLCSRADLQREVRRVETGRDAARVAEADSLRRLERDIHDGPQQRLVRLTMDLGRARHALDEDPARAADALDAALAQARETVDELRALSRGIAPPILVDRGLEAALEEVFARSEVPVAATVDVPDGLAPHVETAVYFVVSEALTNVAKHSGATAARVAVVTTGDRILVEVEDDGDGGAHLSKGHGLAGLEQRVRAADGRLSVSSPAGGPTTIRAEMVCG